MADELKRVGLVFKADGTVDFNKSLKEVNASIKENYSAFKLAQSQWDKNTKASEKLSDRQKYLSNEVKDYTDKVKLLQGQLSELSEKESKNAEKIKKKTEQLNAARNTAESYRQKCDALKIELEQLEKDENSNAEAIQKKKSQVEKAEKAYVDYSSKVEKIEKDIDKLNTGEANNEAAIQKKKAQLENAQATLNNYQKSLEEVNKKLRSGTSDIEEYGKKLEETGKKISDAGKKISDVGGDLTKKATLPIAGLATVAVKTAADFDSAMSQVAAVSGATGDDLDALSQKAREMGSKTKFSASEAAEAMNYMAMAGWDTQDMLNSIEGVMNLAAASGEDLATTSDIVTDAMTAFGLSADGTSTVLKDGLETEVSNATRFVDALAEASRSSNTDVSMLGESFKYVAPVAGSLGYSVEDVSVALGLMANQGIKSSQAGTSLRLILTNMANPTDTMSIAMNALGLSLENTDGSMKTLMEVMEDLRQGFGGGRMAAEEFKSQISEIDMAFQNGELSEEEYEEAINNLCVAMYGAEGAQKAQLAAQIAGKNGMAGLLAIVNSTDEDFQSLTKSIYNASGASQEMADIMQDNLGGQITQLMSQLQELAISFGEMMMPVIRDIVSKIQAFVEKLNAMDEGQRKTIITIGLMVAAIGPVLSIIGRITTGIGGVTQAIGFVMKNTEKMGSVAGTVMNGIGKGASTLFGIIAANPVIAIIAAIIAAVVLLYNNCEWFRDGVNSVIESVVGFFRNFDENVNRIKDSVTQSFRLIRDGALNAFDNIKNGIREKIELAKEIVRNAVNAIKGFFNFEWSLPHIKLPHFSITGKFGLNPPSIPHFSVDWYANGGILNRPTIFGVNGDSLMGGGEAGPEAIMPISVLKRYIRDEIQQNNFALAQILTEAIKSLEIKAENNITIGDRKIYQIITEMVIKEISSKVGSRRASKGVSYV